MTSNISKLTAWLKEHGSREVTNAYFTGRCPADMEYFAGPSCTDPPEDCRTCGSQYRSIDRQKHDNRFFYANEISNTSAEQLLQDYVSNIQSDLKYLRIQLPAFGDAILTRWKKRYKTRDKKAALLRTAFPEIQERKHCVPSLLYDRKLNWCDDRASHRQAWLLPFLSIEALLEEPLDLMYFLHNRTAYDVDQWVMHDNGHLVPGWEAGALRTEFNTNCVVMHGRDYGKMVPHDAEACHQGFNIGYPRARLLLEAQAVLYRFLRKVVETLLEGGSGAGASDKWSTLMGHSNALTAAGGQMHATSLGVVAQDTEHALESLCAIADARQQAAEDDLWLLQTDAAYVQHLLREEQNLTMVKTLAASERWPWTVKDIFYAAVDRFDYWQLCAQLCRAAANAQRAHGHIVGPGMSTSQFPLPYIQAMLLLERYCSSMAHGHSKLVERRLAGCKAFEKYYEFTTTAKGFTICRPKSRRVDFGRDRGFYIRDPLFWALFYMPEPFSFPRPQHLPFEASMLLSLVDDNLAKKPAASRGMVDQHLSTLLADLDVMDQISCAIQTQRPRILPDEKTLDIDGMLGSYTGQRKLQQMARHARDNIHELGKQLEDFSSATWPKGVRDAKWLQEATQARQKLALVWEGLWAVRVGALTKANLTTKDEIDEDLQRFTAHKRTDYLRELEDERLTVKRLIAARKAKHLPPTTDLTTALHDINITEKPTITTLPGKTKVKTRPVHPPIGDEIPAAEDEEEEQEQGEHSPLRIAVKANNLSMFKRMFPAADEPAAKAGVNWQHFLQAMVDAGFAIAQSRGSAVMFCRAEGSIVFHRPHPDPMVDPVMLQVMGKRLRKWFGWDREVFVERDRVTAEGNKD